MRLRDLVVLGVVIGVVVWLLAFVIPAALDAAPRVDDSVGSAPHAVGALSPLPSESRAREPEVVSPTEGSES